MSHVPGLMTEDLGQKRSIEPQESSSKSRLCGRFWPKVV